MALLIFTVFSALHISPHYFCNRCSIASPPHPALHPIHLSRIQRLISCHCFNVPMTYITAVALTTLILLTSTTFTASKTSTHHHHSHTSSTNSTSSFINSASPTLSDNNSTGSSHGSTHHGSSDSHSHHRIKSTGY